MPALLEGGSFKCGLHGKTEFVTADPEVWTKHRLEHETIQHTFFGRKPCATCGKITTFDNEPEGINSFCPKCKDKLIKDFKKDSNIKK